MGGKCSKRNYDGYNYDYINQQQYQPKRRGGCCERKRERRILRQLAQQQRLMAKLEPMATGAHSSQIDAPPSYIEAISATHYYATPKATMAALPAFAKA